MDSLTQIVLGAAVGEVVLGRKVGNKAMMWGAVAGTIPDLDMLTSFFVDDLRANELHRGFSHSIVFCLIASPIFAHWVKRYERFFLSGFFLTVFAIFFFALPELMPRLIIGGLAAVVILPILFKLKRSDTASTWQWTKLFWWCLFTHPILDCHTSWGTQILWPLPYKFAWNNIFVADFFYTLPFLICLLIAMVLRRESRARRIVNYVGIGISSAYMLLTLGFKYMAHTAIAESLQRQEIDYEAISTRPTPLNAVLWAANVRTEETYYLAYHSILAPQPEIDFIPVPKRHELLGRWADHDKVQRLIRLSQGEYVVRKGEGEEIIFNDLRFGQLGQPAPDGDFVFAYRLVPEGDGRLGVYEIPPPRPQGQEAMQMMEELYHRAVDGPPVIER